MIECPAAWLLIEGAQELICLPAAVRATLRRRADDQLRLIAGDATQTEEAERRCCTPTQNEK
jgi:hypothetical protein